MRKHTHISQEFDRELEDIRGKVSEMGGMVETQLVKALDALSRGDTELAETVAHSDYQVNSLEVEIDRACTEILAKRTPAASDLRLVLAVTKIITDLERVGDEAEKIGRFGTRVIESQSSKSYYTSVLAMGGHVQNSLNEALDAFARMDADGALLIAKQDVQVDRQNEAITRQLITYMMEDPRSITGALDVAWTVRSLERIGDHAKNICESVIYMVKGMDIRHVSLDTVEKELKET